MQYGFIVNWRIALTMVNTGKLIDDENGALSKKCELNDVQPKRWRGGESEETTASALILGLWQVRLKLCNHLPFFFIICIMVMILQLPPPSSSSSSSYFLLTILTFLHLSIKSISTNHDDQYPRSIFVEMGLATSSLDLLQLLSNTLSYFDFAFSISSLHPPSTIIILHYPHLIPANHHHHPHNQWYR